MGKKEIYLRYSNTRDVVFVLGAGASHPDGVPLQRDILPLILSGEIAEVKNSYLGKLVADFINHNYKYGKEKDQYPRLEAVFGFLDYFIQQNESLSSEYPYSTLIAVKEALIKLIHYVVDFKSDKSSTYYHLFWEAVEKYNSNISIITLNYDTLLEQGYRFLFEKFGYIDYSIHLMNYNEYSSSKTKFTQWVNPREPISIDKDLNPVPTKILKIHGSLNWKYCNCCNQTLLTPWDKKIDLQQGKFLGYTYPERREYEYNCPLDGTDFQTLIMPPSNIKTLNHPVISQLLSEAAREIRSTKKIVFFGYSLSDADVHIKALFQKNLEDDVKIYVVNSRSTKKMKLRFRSLHPNVEFIESPFEQVVQNEEILSQLFMKEN
ncbi:MAG: SIR2 family protein [Melioribacteraceae bacterium]|nr:MAG: SIR2 family protein [Melioribacteraceae bacterium]